MEISLRTTGIAEVALSVKDLKRSRIFYERLLNFPVVLETEQFFVCSTGGTRISFSLAENPGDSSGKGSLECLTLGCPDIEELERVAGAFKTAKVPNSGILTGRYTGKKYMDFEDPDGICWRFSLL